MKVKNQILSDNFVLIKRHSALHLIPAFSAHMKPKENDDNDTWKHDENKKLHSAEVQSWLYVHNKETMARDAETLAPVPQFITLTKFMLA